MLTHAMLTTVQTGAASQSASQWMHSAYHWLLSANFTKPQIALGGISFVLLLFLPLHRRKYRWPGAIVGSIGFIMSGLLGLFGLSLALMMHTKRGPHRFMVALSPWVLYGILEVWLQPSAAKHEWRVVVTVTFCLLVVAGLMLYRLTRPLLDPVRFASASQREQCLAQYGNCCAGCGASGNNPGVQLQIDHIIPWSKGGASELSNFQPLCATCNGSSRKGSKSQAEFERILRKQGIRNSNLGTGSYYKFAKKQSEKQPQVA